MERTPWKHCQKSPWRWRKRKARGIDRLSTDMILKPWYWKLESPWIHISKTLILAPLTAGLAFTLTSRQLLLQISHGNFILLTICFPPLPPSLLCFVSAGLQLLTGLHCIPIRIRRRWVDTWSLFSSFSEKSSYPPFLECEVERKLKRNRHILQVTWSHQPAACHIKVFWTSLWCIPLDK